ncbi:hypothetical protein J1792_09265 [Streptomyces triculaminicus]|uniref:Uncharacterized protein n=1 Tax=Streptomyces triculaminicus TaxID=2816232 RepID=A0A939FK43_9ACTN|nr:hypothetical protein [Streptomyces triculaminicus]MBO0652973.1 hypothetical protein [Streptomyces triculaminicus]
MARAKSFVMHMTGGPVELPSTILGIREALPERQRDEFNAEVEHAEAADLPLLLARWAMRIPAEQDAAEADVVDRVKAGDFSGVTFDNESDDAWRSAG